MRPDTLLLEAVAYFKSNKGFHRAFKLMRDKYKALGTFGGTIKLQNLSLDEKEVLTGFFRKDYIHRKSASIKIQDFQKALEGTKFRGLLMEDILYRYYGEELVSNRQVRDRYLLERETFFNGVICQYEGSLASEWLKDVYEARDNAYKVLMQRYDSDQEGLLHDINAVCQGINRLPVLSGKRLRLPVFASRITKNPHAFDEDTSCGRIFLYALMHRFGVHKPKNAEEKAELYYAAGILLDEVSNYVLCFGLKAYDNGVCHPGWDGFYKCNESLQVSLANLSTLDRVKSPWGKVYVFENPGVFSTVLDKISYYNPPLICTYGQVKIASLVLLDLLAKEGTDIYYSGDFDPEGLKIADKLKIRYGNRLKLWRYDVQDYINAISGEALDNTRLKKMESLQSEKLVDLAGVIRQRACAGYQELLLDKIVEDILEGK